MSTESRLPETAHEQGAIFYKLPADLTPDDIDPLLRDVVRVINASGWLWTAESCQGHPDAASLADTGWPHNTDPFLRLVCHQDDEARFLLALVRNLNPSPESIGRGWPSLQGARLYREARGEYAETMVYLPARNAMERDAGVAAFMRFAAAVGREA
jgi:hypothetical protein